MKWFKHMVDSGDDPDIGAIVDQFGFKGYYVFFRTLEIMSREFDIENPGEMRCNFNWFLSRFPRGITKKFLRNFFEFTSKLNHGKGRFQYKIEGNEIWLKNEKLKDLTDTYTDQILRSKLKESSKKVRSKFDNKKKEERSKNNNTVITNVITPPNGKKSGSADSPKSSQKPKINFNFETGEWENIPEEDIERWKKTYPACDIQQELLEMADWLLNNPQKRKKNYRRFISNWLSREQERGGTKRPVYQSYRDIEKAKLEAELRVGRRPPEKLTEGEKAYLELRRKQEMKLWNEIKPKIKNGEISMQEAEGQIRNALARWHEANYQKFQQEVSQ